MSSWNDHIDATRQTDRYMNDIKVISSELFDSAAGRVYIVDEQGCKNIHDCLSSLAEAVEKLQGFYDRVDEQWKESQINMRDTLSLLLDKK